MTRVPRHEIFNLPTEVRETSRNFKIADGNPTTIELEDERDGIIFAMYERLLSRQFISIQGSGIGQRVEYENKDAAALVLAELNKLEENEPTF